MTDIDRMENIRAVLFDVDDTLFDRKGAQLLALERLIERLPGIFQDIEQERIAAAFVESDLITTRDFDAGAPSEGLREIRSRLFLRMLGLSEDHAGTITEIYLREYPAVNAAMPGAGALVKGLDGRYLKGIVSNGFPDIQYTKLETIGLRREFSCIVLSEEFGVRKPDPRIFTHAAALLNVKPAECLYVGDSYKNDVIGAAGAGIRTCWFKHNSAMHPTGDLKADMVINNLAELAVILK